MTHEEYVAQVRAEMERLAGLLATPHNFTCWLDTYKDGESVGSAGIPSCCPLARCIGKWTTNDMGYEVDTQPGSTMNWGIHATVEDARVFVPLAFWAGKFADYVDSRHRTYERVTALQARTLVACVSSVTA